MSTNKIIKCDLCGYEFKTFSKIEKRYHDFESYDEICYYPVPEEKAHLINNYICNDCYNKISTKVKEILTITFEKYINTLINRKEDKYKKYLSEIKNLEEKNNEIKKYLTRLNNINSILDLTQDEIKNLNMMSLNHELHNKGSLYLQKAIEIEKNRKGD